MASTVSPYLRSITYVSHVPHVNNQVNQFPSTSVNSITNYCDQNPLFLLMFSPGLKIKSELCLSPLHKYRINFPVSRNFPDEVGYITLIVYECRRNAITKLLTFVEPSNITCFHNYVGNKTILLNIESSCFMSIA